MAQSGSRRWEDFARDRRGRTREIAGKKEEDYLIVYRSCLMRSIVEAKDCASTVRKRSF